MKPFALILSLLSSQWCMGLNAVFSPSVTSGCTPLVVTFTDQSTGSPVSWDYDFGDGGNSSTQNPTYTFTKPGKYLIRLRVSDGSSNSTATRTIIVRKLPKADFQSLKTEYCPDESFQFLNTTTPGDTSIKSSTWDFGDGNLGSSNGNIYKSYSSAGIYTIKLSVTDNFGCSHTSIRNAYIVINQKPNLVFKVNTIHACNGPQKVEFVNTSSNAASYKWDLGDGSTSTLASPIVYYNQEKTFQVKLEAYSSKNCYNSSTVNVPIKFGKIKAQFTADDDTGCKPFLVRFTGQNLPVGSKFDYNWDFGDNSGSNLENPLKTYMKTGNFRVRLIISGTGPNCKDTAYRNIVVSDKPDAKVFVSDTVGCDGGLKTTFKAKSSKIRSHTWFIDGKNIDTYADSLTYTFYNTGFYNVVVLLTDSFGCQQSFGFPRVVVQNVNLNIDIKVKGGCVPYQMEYTNKSKIAIKQNYKYDWTDGNGNWYTGEHPDIVLRKEGDQEVFAYYRDSFGCKDEFSIPLSISHPIPPSFKMDKTSICNGETITFENTMSDSLKNLVTTFYWELGTEHSYNRDIFSTSLNQRQAKLSPKMVTNHKECLDTLSFLDTIELKPTWSNFVYYFDTCYVHTIRLVSYTDYATFLEWELPDGTKSHDSVVLYHYPDGVEDMKFKLTTKNSLTQCESVNASRIGIFKTVSQVGAMPLSGCTPMPVFFNNGSFANHEHWDLGNGDTSNATDSFTYHSYQQPGDYKIVHTGWDFRGCKFQSTTNVHVDGPKAKGKVWPMIGCLPLKLTLQDSVKPVNIKKRIWRFQDDPNGKIAKKPYEAFDFTITKMPSNGDSIYRIELIVEDSFGCISTQVFKIRPIGPRAPNTVQPVEQCNADRFECRSVLDSATAYYPVTFNWDMGDGKVIHKPNFDYFYEKGGKYLIKLTVVDGMGCQFSSQYNVRATDPLILAKFSADTHFINCPPLTVKFKDESLTDPNNPITQYLWDFGDGSTSTLQNPSKIYTQTGTYKVSLTVNSIFNCESKTVLEDFIKVGGPVAAHSVSTSGTCQPVVAKFKTLLNKGTLAEWDFGQGNTSKALNPVFQYQTPGTYIPKIFLTDSNGCKAIIVTTDTVHVRTKPKAIFVSNEHCFKSPVHFTNRSVSNLINNTNLNSFWRVEDKTYTDKDASHAYAYPGNSNVRLIVVNDDQCADTSSRTVRISRPLAKIQSDKTQYCEGQLFQFINQSYSDDGLIRQELLINDLPLTPASPLPNGDFEIKYTLSDSFNCTDTFKLPGKIHVVDTGSLAPPEIIRISQVNNGLEFIFKKINDLDFKDYRIDRIGYSGSYRNLNSVTDTQHIFSGLTANTSHCFVLSYRNTCSAESSPSDTHCNINLDVQPLSNANQLRWNPYGGWVPGLYEVERWKDNVFEKIGTSPDTFFTDSTVTCHVKHIYRINALGSIAEKHSMSDTAQGKAIWLNRLPVPQITNLSVADDTAVELKLKLDKTYNKSVLEHIEINRYNGNNHYTSLMAPDQTLYRDRAVNVDLRNYNYRLRVKDNCGDTGQFSSMNTQILLTDAMKPGDTNPVIHWNKYTVWDKGVDHYDVYVRSENGSYIKTGETKDTFYTDESGSKICIRDYQYKVVAIPADTIQLIASSNTIRLKPLSTLFVPNAFSPDGNGINETFGPKGQFVYDYSIEIFNSWGEKLFRSTDCFAEWDGSYQGETCQDGLYYYMVHARGTDGKLYNLNGIFYLLR